MRSWTGASKSDLNTRWEDEAGLRILARLGDLIAKMEFPGHGRTSQELLAALEELPARDEVGGRDLRGAPLRGCLVGLDLRGWDFSYARLDLDFVDCDLSEACFDEAIGHSIKLGHRLDGARFRRARITSGDFRDATARKACFDGAILTGSWFEGADLTNATFRDARCREARFGHARIVGCDFRRANLDQAVFVGARLNQSTDLDGASLLGLNSLKS